MNWIDTKERLPEKKKRVLLYYKKNKEYIMTEGYITDEAEDTASEDNPVEFWRSHGYGLTWYDSQRQIQSLLAKSSKNKVLFWTELPDAPKL